ncbi:MAG: type II secretion system-associated lipoprotein [Spirochaetes bacterium]|jgi:type II secretion system-associated lipoprotein|nr:type II secretion system-associated lipoprotein [Spirochaetota bacterium]
MNKFVLPIIIACVLLPLGCSSFIKDDQVASLKKREAFLYELKKNIEYEKETVLGKGDAVRIFFITSKSYVKVYAYPHEKGYLASEHYLVLYLFEEDFEDDLFNEAQFSEEFDKIVIKKRALTQDENIIK